MDENLDDFDDMDETEAEDVQRSLENFEDFLKSLDELANIDEIEAEYETHEEYVRRGLEMENETPTDGTDFERRWGGLAFENFEDALKRGQGRDRIIAICVIGCSTNPRVRELLLPFLASSEPKERWASARCLGAMKEDEALPVLLGMLTEFLPREGHPYPLGDDNQWPELWRLYLPFLLRSWDHTSITAALRQALLQNIAAEQYMPDDKQMAHDFQQMLCYELGRRRAFGALTGVELPGYQLGVYIVQMAMGYALSRVSNLSRADELRYKRVYNFEVGTNQRVTKELLEVLSSSFGFTEKEGLHYLDGYWKNWETLCRNGEEEPPPQEVPPLDEEERAKIRQRFLDELSR